jgi:hypothetical protein
MKSFQLEEILPGAFLLQGLAGGALSGFAFVVIPGLWSVGGNFISTLFVTLFFMCITGIIGLIEAVIIWGVYRFFGFDMRATTRLAVASVVTPLSVAFYGRQFEYLESDLNRLLIWALSIGLPVALLVGSHVKPWALFTFGSIAANVNGFETRLRS